VAASMRNNLAGMIVFATNEESEAWNNMDCEYGSLKDLYQEKMKLDEEVNANSRWDASIEEVLHLVQNYGYGQVYPDLTGYTNGGNALADARCFGVGSAICCSWNRLGMLSNTCCRCCEFSTLMQSTRQCLPHPAIHNGR